MRRYCIAYPPRLPIFPAHSTERKRSVLRRSAQLSDAAWSTLATVRKAMAALPSTVGRPAQGRLTRSETFRPPPRYAGVNRLDPRSSSVTLSKYKKDSSYALRVMKLGYYFVFEGCKDEVFAV